MSRPRRRTFFWVAFTLVWLIAIVLFAIRTPPLPEREATPSPNGYDDFLQAATLLQGTPPKRTNEPPEWIAAYVATNQPALERLRIGLTRPSLAPPYNLTNAEVHLQQIGGFKHLGILLAHEADLGRQAGDWDRLVTSSLQGVEFGQRIARGGVLIDQLVATAVEAIGRAPLERAMPDLPAAFARKAALALANLENTRESFQRVLLTEEAFVRRNLPFTQRIAWHLVLKRMTQASFSRAEAKATAVILATRELTLALAARAYTLERGQPPASPEALVPEYLPAVPDHPTTGEPLKLPSRSGGEASPP